jgi:hypothetical protein
MINSFFVGHSFIKPASAPASAVFSGGYKVFVNAACLH